MKPTTELHRREIITGLRITPDGCVQKIEIPTNAILDGLYAAIGCNAVDVVRLTDQLDMWIDDEGLCNAEVNPLATTLAHHFQSDIPARYRQPYFGTAVFLGIDHDTGDTRSLLGTAELTAAQLAQLQSALQHA
ncbi:MAG: DUF3846 domain-containing protein [Pseudonocardiaceae bacterium]